MDKYDAANDHYCYQGTDILINKLDIRNMEVLEGAEREVTALTARKIVFCPPPYNLEYMSYLHDQLFSELYGWAGELRNIDISKGGTRFCNWGRIVAEANKLFIKLEREHWLSDLSKDEFCDKAAEYYCEINMIHPFREGNGRVQRLLFEHLSLAAGYDLNWGDIEPGEWIQANIDGYYVDYKRMSEIFRRIVTRC